MAIKDNCVIDGCTEQGKTVELGQIPGAPSLTLCSGHSWDLFWDRKREARDMATAIHEANPEMQHTPGFTYVIRLANGHVKIGYTNRSNPNQVKRLGDLSDKRNQNMPVQVLALMRGGDSLEAVLQSRWSHLRVQGAMEQFHPDPSLLEWASEQGIDPAVSGFDDYVIRKHNRGSVSEYAQEMRDYIGDGDLPFQKPFPEFLTDKLNGWT
ncbi:hypothetical protein ABZU94_38525 [Streptomyces mirabilis]|uniref:hypothetical protein n=1 Tax=Streptomyces sp. NPDC005388 TaxID=3156717 RepID=UPI0033BA587C